MYNIRIVPKNVEMSKLQVSKNIDNFFMDSDKLYFTVNADIKFPNIYIVQFFSRNNEL